MAHEKVRIGSFEFNEVKNQIKDFLKSKPEFSDYNFEGSNLSVLIDVLAYNTHYKTLLANMAANEMFIDTATRRSNVVSHAKALGYTPKSRSAAKANIDYTVTFTSASAPASLVMPVNTKFSASVDNQVFTFVTTSEYTAVRQTTGTPDRYTYTFSGVTLFEGVYSVNQFVYNTADKTITIPNRNVDTGTLTVKVEVEDSSVVESFFPVTSLLVVDSESKVFFLDEGFSGYYELHFGDGTLGREPANGSLVTITYVVTNGEAANGAGALNNGTDSFSLASSVQINGTSVVESVVVNSAAAGGKEAESIESVRFNSLNYYGTLNRAVVSEDYAALVSSNISNVRQVISWGGENANPPRYGSVFLCVIPQFGSILTDAEKKTIRDFLKSKSVANVSVEFEDPEYIDIVINSTVRYNRSELDVTVFDLESIVRDTISEFSTDTLQQFSGIFRYSTLLGRIDESHPSILNSNVEIAVTKEIVPNLFSTEDIRFSISNKIDTAETSPAITSSGFFIEGNTNKLFLEDNRKGALQLVYYVGDRKALYDFSAGSVNYITGEVIINPLNVVSYDGDFIKFSIKLSSDDVISSRNVILRIKSENVTVSAVPDYSI